MGAIVKNIPIINNTEPYFVLIGENGSEKKNYIKFKYNFINKSKAKIKLYITDAKTGKTTKTITFKDLSTNTELTSKDGYYLLSFSLLQLFNNMSIDAFYADYKNQQFYVYIVITDGEVLKSPIVVKNLIYKPMVTASLIDAQGDSRLVTAISFDDQNKMMNATNLGEDLNILIDTSNYKLSFNYNPGENDNDQISSIVLKFYKGTSDTTQYLSERLLKTITNNFRSPRLTYTRTLDFNLLPEFLLDYFDDNTSTIALNLELEVETLKGLRMLNKYCFIMTINLDNSTFFSQTINFSTSVNDKELNLKNGHYISHKITLTKQSTTPVTGIEFLLYRKKMVGKDESELPWTLICSQRGSVWNSNKLTALLTDYFVEPGVSYKYRILGDIFFPNASVSQFIKACETTTDPITLISEDMYLYTPSQTLAIKYNPSLNQYKYNIAEAVVNTIGGQYPYIMQNGNQKYRTFTIGGLISYNSEVEDGYYVSSGTGNDFQSNFSDSLGDAKLSLDPFRNSLFLNNAPLLTDEQKNLPLEHQRIISEKVFRDKVIEFLYSKQPMLFKSLQEGLIVVKLTQISLTPNAQLGRNVYSFNATAVEIADNSVETLREIFQN